MTFSPENKYKPILSVGNSHFFRNANLASVPKYHCHKMTGIVWIIFLFKTKPRSPSFKNTEIVG